jgi:hypothetical protein
MSLNKESLVFLKDFSKEFLSVGLNDLSHLVIRVGVGYSIELFDRRSFFEILAITRQ